MSVEILSFYYMHFNHRFGCPKVTKFGIYINPSKKIDNSMSFGVGVAWGLQRAPYCNALPQTCKCMNDIRCAYFHEQTHKKPSWTHTLSPTESHPHFLNIFMSRILTTSFYRFNTTVFTFSQYHPQTLKMKCYQKLSPTSYLLAVVMPSMSILHQYFIKFREISSDLHVIV